MGTDPSFFAELVDDFLAEAPAQLETARRALSSGDPAALCRAVHTLKGQSRMFGAHDLAVRCQEIESAAGAGDLDALLEQLGGLVLAWDRVRLELLVVRSET